MNSDPRYLKDDTVGSSALTIFTLVSVSLVMYGMFEKAIYVVCEPTAEHTAGILVFTVNRFISVDVFYIMRTSHIIRPHVVFTAKKVICAQFFPCCAWYLGGGVYC